MRARGFTVLVSAALVTAGCGSSGSSKPNALPTTPTTAATAPSTPKQLAADKALARRAVLHQSDLPPAYRAEPDDSSDNSDAPPAVVKRLATCAHVPVQDAKALLNNVSEADAPHADSPTFSHDNKATLTQSSFGGSVIVARSPERIERFLVLIDRANARGCWDDFVKAAFASGDPAGAQFSDFHVYPARVDVHADHSAGISADLRITSRGVTLPVHFDILFARLGRAGAALFAYALGARTDAALERTLLQKMLDRLDAA